MTILNLEHLTPFKKLFSCDSNNREINIYKLKNIATQKDIFYPNCLFVKEDTIINPSSEKIMSLNLAVIGHEQDKIEKYQVTKTVNQTLFFFIYNTDNYYHFIYDSLPYLISFLELKKDIPELKLLMNYPNFQKKEFYNFVSEFLEILNIYQKDIIIIENNTSYSELYISSSYTHGINSNLPPRKEIYDLYKLIVNKIKNKYSAEKNLPKKIYISRRTWINKDTSNIGTNYTTRRRLQCEDQLIDLLEKNGFTEIFTENLSTIDKILLFDNAECVIGPIGGGLCNVLFSKETCKLITICSPLFFEINSRFKYCFSNVNVEYYTNTFHVEKDKWKKWMRIKSNNIIGEIEEVLEDELIIAYTEKEVAGWNNDIEYKKIKINKNHCIPLDNGLNSLWSMDIEYFKKNYKL